ncbi:hypothetical protein [Aliiglaciecola sp. LCG003]|uniref:hypothetical protein n=1 Tax=Aliiglaciecola sp. LCG003 TaxID=3053655 RepID=UPI002572D399|nr:hypothetical protein [Aliiglaciecola sp. LCG003]WJG10684.1 hypothetical protein QR722_06475 [Aliiglaciecola sp. LCG003]
MQQKRSTSPSIRHVLSVIFFSWKNYKVSNVFVTLFMWLVAFSIEASENIPLKESFPADEITHLYQIGDTIVFKGTVSLTKVGAPTNIMTIQVKQELLPSRIVYLDKSIMTLRTTTTFLDSGEQQVSQQDIWQEPTGALFELTDPDGKEIVIGSAFDKGLMALPEYSAAITEYQIKFYSIYGGPNSRPVTQGSRTITVAPQKTIFTPNGETLARKINHQETYEYLFTFADNKRSSYMVTERNMWISPSKGLIKKVEVVRNYSHSGVLQSTARWELEVKQ